MARKLGLACVSILLLFTFTACNTNNGGGNVERQDSRQFGMNAARNGNESLGKFRNDRFQDETVQRRNDQMRGAHNNSKMESSREIAQAIAAMDNVNNAYVLLTDRNAYVAVGVDEDQDYARNSQLRLDRVQLGGGEPYQRPAAEHGSNLQFGEYHRMDNGVTQVMKNQIADKVKALKPEVRNVYVSANPDFAGRLQGYVDKVEAGQPIEGLIEEFNTLVERLFPQEAANRNTSMINQMNRR